MDEGLNAEGRAVQRDLVLIGASAGGVNALQELVRALPPEFPAAILVVLHVPATGTSVLPQILSRRGPLPAAFAEDEQKLERGHIYVAPADHHMLVRGERINLTRGPRENGHRPAIDPLFRSAARMAALRCIGVVLSGLLDDGASGLRFLKECGGTAVVQDPADSEFPSMPEAAMSTTAVDRVVPMAEMARTLCELVDRPLSAAAIAAVEDRSPVPDPNALQGRDRAELRDPLATAQLVDGPPSPLTCPECGGALWEIPDGPELRFGCSVGHAFTLATLGEEQGRELEGTLWSAIRSLEERAEIHRRLAHRAPGERATVYADRARAAESHARSLHEVLRKAAGRRAIEPS